MEEEAWLRCQLWSQPGRAHLIVARLYAVAVPGTCSHMAERILPVVVSPAAAATQLLA